MPGRLVEIAARLGSLRRENGAVDDLVHTLGFTGLSKLQVSVTAQELDEHVEKFRTHRTLRSESVHVRGRPRPGAHGPRRWSCRARSPVGRDRRQRRRAPPKRLNREIRGGMDVVRIFPDRASIIRLVRAVLAEQHDEWAEGRRYHGLDVLTRAQAVDASSPRR